MDAWNKHSSANSLICVSWTTRKSSDPLTLNELERIWRSYILTNRRGR
jgi:hypothetical protein